MRTVVSVNWLSKWGKKPDRTAVEAFVSGAGSAPPQTVRPAQRSEASARTMYFPPPSPRSSRVFELPDGGRQPVVGESHYQSAIRAAVAGLRVPLAGPDGWELAPSIDATLRPEPSNPYDRRAVAVDLGGKCVGYLPREDARKYHDQIAGLAAEGYRATCVARVVRTESGYLAVYLHLAPADDVAVAIGCRANADYLGGRRRAGVPAANAWQGSLRPVYNSRSRDPIMAELRLGNIDRGKYAGQQCIDVFVGDIQIGSLTRRMTERYERRVMAANAAGRKAICPVIIEKGVDDLIHATLCTCDYE